jgi:hypothetical protein
MLYLCAPFLSLIFFSIFQDIQMHRGKPLYLNEERYAALNYMVKEIFVFIKILILI